jgi:hypothetical protein
MLGCTYLFNITQELQKSNGIFAKDLSFYGLSSRLTGAIKAALKSLMTEKDK